MITIRNRKQVFIAAAAISGVSLMIIMVHLQINYPAEIREIVRARASLATVIVSYPLGLFLMFQLLKTNRLSDELQRLVNRDRLTDVATRDFFFSRLKMSSDAYGVSLMVDIDNFKRVNDTYGHLAGDAVIQRVAEALKNNVRPDDIVCRFGGEEFVVFLQSATTDDGWRISERIRQEIEAASTPSKCGAIRVTVSVGGSMKESIDHIDAAIARADDCLYRAKALGRNRTVVDWHAEGAGSAGAQGVSGMLR